MLADQQELIYISSGEMLDLIWKICQEQWMLQTHGRKGLGKSQQSRQVDDDDNEATH